MRFRPDRYAELRRLLRRGGQREVEEELRHHIDESVADGVARGLSETAAREDALRRFGDVERYRRETLALDERARREERRMQVFDAFWRETRHAVRSLLRAPLFTSAAVLTLAFGIGATAAVYTLLDSIVIRPLPYPEPTRLVQVMHAVPGVQAEARWGTSEAQYFYYRDRARSFESLGGYTSGSFALSEDGLAEQVDGALVTASLLDVLGIRTVLGRSITEADDVPGAEGVVVLGHDLWRTAFDGDPGVLNRRIRIDGELHTVIGVAAAGARLPMQRTQLWLPLRLDRGAPPVNSHWVGVYARLRSAVAPEQAAEELASFRDRLVEEFPQAYSQRFYRSTGFTPTVTTIRSELLGGIERVLWILLGAVLLVLLIAAANVANLFMVRAQARRRELALRSSLGAERAHLAVQYLAEALALSLLAGALGLALAWGTTRVLTSLAPSGLPRVDDITLGWRVISVAFGLAILAGLVFGLFPVIRPRIEFAALREGGRGATASRRQHFARNALVVAQMAMALVLLAAGALLLQSYVNLRRVDPGIDPDGVLTFEVSAPPARYPDHLAVHDFYRQLTERIAALPGVQSVGGTSWLPFGAQSGCAHTVTELAPGQPPTDAACVPTPLVLPGYFEALGIAVRGRTFDWRMLDRREGVAVISRALAQRFFPGEDPIGKGIMSFRDGPPWYRIIGVADDVRNEGYDRPPAQAIYYPQMPMEIPGTWMPARSVTMTVRAPGIGSAALAPTLRGILRELDPEVPVANLRPMGDVISRSPTVARASFALLLLAVSAAMALFLNVVGLYGVVSYVVAQRRSEIGVRLALGARSDQVRKMVLVQSLRVVLIGVAIGVPAALLGTRLLRSILFGVSATDLGTFAGVTLLLLLVAAAATYLPALRAAATPPMQVLREE